MLRTLALLSPYIPYLVQTKKQHQHKNPQLDPHAHDFTFLKAYKSPRVFIPSDHCKSGPRPSIPRTRTRHERQTVSENAAKRAKKIDPKVDFLQPRLLYRVTRLAVSDVHGDFEAETQISRCWCSPCHDYLLVVLRGLSTRLTCAFTSPQAVSG